jgi:hypothetical protein
MNGSQEIKSMLRELIDTEKYRAIGAQEQPILRPNLRAIFGEKQMSKMLYLLPICCLLVGGGLISCRSSPLGGLSIGSIGGNVTKISDIQQSKSVDATVYLQGQVTNRAPFLTNGAYKLQDGTGAIWVIADQNLPNLGDQLSIKGQLQYQSIPVGGQDLGEVYVLERQQIRRRAGQLSQPVSGKGSPKP